MICYLTSMKVELKLKEPRVAIVSHPNSYIYAIYEALGFSGFAAINSIAFACASHPQGKQRSFWC